MPMLNHAWRTGGLLFIACAAIAPGCASGPRAERAEAADGGAAVPAPPSDESPATQDDESIASAAPAVASPPASTPEEALRLGIEWLLTNQNADGSWGGFHSTRPYEVYLDNISSHRGFEMASTALCAMALIEPSMTDERAKASLDRALHFMLTAEQPGRASGNTFYNTWAHTYAVQALAMLYADARYVDRRAEIEPIIRRELLTLADLQNASGGWGYYDFDGSFRAPSGAQSTSFNTGAALVAIKTAMDADIAGDEDVIEFGIACLESMRLPSGAYIYGFDARYLQTAGFNQVKGSLGRSQPCNLALWEFQRNMTVEDMVLGLENLRKFHYIIEIGRGRQFPHEAWYQTAGYYYFFGHYYAACVIEEVPEPQQSDYAAWLAEVMRGTQDPGGSWFDFPFYGYSRPYGTAFGVLTLQKCLNAMKD
jgi:hypothetical protein